MQNKEHDMSELIMYLVVNKDIIDLMSTGKISAQVSHVATIIAVEESNTSNENSERFFQWYNASVSQKKVVLVAHEKDLLKLIDNGFYFIHDNGLTEIKSGSLTCVGKIMSRGEALKFVKRLQLCK